MTKFLFVILVGLMTNARTIKIALPWVVDEVTFDDSRTSEQELRRWMNLSPEVSPYNNYLFPESLEACDQTDARYRNCGRSQPFPDAVNAKLNLERIHSRIDSLDEKQYPPDLSQVVFYLRKVQQFSLWREQKKLAFFQTGQVSVLETPFEALDPKKECGAILEKIRPIKDSRAAYPLVIRDWRNCVTEAEQKQIGDYPKAAWAAFLGSHGMREKATHHEGDDDHD